MCPIDLPLITEGAANSLVRVERKCIRPLYDYVLNSRPARNTTLRSSAAGASFLGSRTMNNKMTVFHAYNTQGRLFHALPRIAINHCRRRLLGP